MRNFVKRVTTKISKLTPEQLEQLLDSLTDENEALNAVLESLSTGLLICNVDWHLESKNNAVSHYIPITLQSGSVPIWEIVGEKSIAEFLKSSSSNQKKYISEDFTLSNFEEVTKVINVAILPLVRSRKLCGHIIQIEDITEKRNQEILIHQMENLESLTNLAANVAHEIKNPLGAISIHIQLIQRSLKKARLTDGKRLSENYVENYVENYLEIVNEEIDRLNKIILNFLSAVRPINSNLKLTDPAKLIASFIDFFSAEFNENGILLETELMPSPPSIMVDANLFHQMLINLAQNSIAAMPDGGFVWINTTVKNDCFTLNFVDSGVGIDEHTLNHIFEPYFTTKAQGTGLGLTMVYKIIKEFSGEINVRSFLDEGTLFSISLPLPQKDKWLLEYEKTGD